VARVPVIEDRARWTLPHVLERAADRFGDRPFLSFALGATELTFADVHQRATTYAGALRELGVERGDRVLIMLPNRAEFVLTWFAVNLLGAVQVPVNIDYRGEFLEHVVQTARARLAVTDHPELFERAVTPDELGRGPAGAAVQTRPQDLAAIHFTSGTTGRSKGAMMSFAHQHLLAEQNGAWVELGPDDVYMTSLPLFHVNAQLTAVYAALLVGARVHLEPKFSASRWLDVARATRATVTTTLGVMMPFLLAQPERPEDGDNALRCVWAVPCPRELAEPFGRRFGIERFAMGYGNTEVGFVIDPRERPPAGSCGRPDTRFYDIALVDPETDEPVATGEPGEVVVRPKVPWIVSGGYYGMPERTAEAFRNLWFHTGDSLVRDEDGWLYFVDRIHDRIRRRGENIASADVELVLTQHDAVAEAAVVAVPSELAGGEDELMACLVLHRDAPLTDIVAFGAARLPAFAVPRYFQRLDELPKTPTAKVRKQLLRERGITPQTMDRLATR
jgi:crotonobetaine/carnitine-CoA ligase